MCRLSIKALRHYDDAKLLVPARTDANGYRYYDRSQARQAISIALMRSLDLPLQTIREAVRAPTHRAVAVMRLLHLAFDLETNTFAETASFNHGEPPVHPRCGLPSGESQGSSWRGERCRSGEERARRRPQKTLAAITIAASSPSAGAMRAAIP